MDIFTKVEPAYQNDFDRYYFEEGWHQNANFRHIKEKHGRDEISNSSLYKQVDSSSWESPCYATKFSVGMYVINRLIEFTLKLNYKKIAEYCDECNRTGHLPISDPDMEDSAQEGDEAAPGVAPDGSLVLEACISDRKGYQKFIGGGYYWYDVVTGNGSQEEVWRNSSVMNVIITAIINPEGQRKFFVKTAYPSLLDAA